MFNGWEEDIKSAKRGSVPGKVVVYVVPGIRSLVVVPEQQGVSTLQDRTVSISRWHSPLPVPWW